MHCLLLPVVLSLSFLSRPTLGLPYIFERTVEGFTPLAPRAADVQSNLGPLLSKNASLYFPNSAGFQNATNRWSAYAEPKIAIVVEPGIDQDVATTVVFANKFSIPFLAVNKGHGSPNTLANVQNGIEIYVRVLNEIIFAPDGNSATLGGGVYNDEILQTMWDNGKASASGSCGCVGAMGAGLGGGYGRYQGFYGLISDNIISANMVLADGSMVTVSETSNPDLYWGIRGAGHNFGIVTRFDMKIYDYPAAEWYFITLVFTQDKLEALVTQVNKMMGSGTQPKELMNYFVYAWNPEISTIDPVIILNINYVGTQAQAQQYVAPYLALNPAYTNDGMLPYPEIAGATGTGSNDFACQHGYNRIQYPVGLLTYNISTSRQVFELFKNQTLETPAFNLSTVAFEGYSLEAVKAVASDSTAFPHREDNILASILAVYAPDPALDAQAVAWGKQTRDMLHAGDEPGRMLNVYVNYAFGDETQEQIYGYEPWRLDKLRALKKEYDPHGRFNYYNPIIV